MLQAGHRPCSVARRIVIRREPTKPVLHCWNTGSDRPGVSSYGSRVVFHCP
jgi:hypothetical protein